MNKIGPFSNQEIIFVRQAHAEGMEPTEIARRLNRNLTTVLKHTTKKDEAASEAANIARDLESQPEWEMLKSEFTPDELRYFKHRYGKLMKQFKGDVWPTEETQVFQVIKFEILQNRNLAATKKALLEIERTERELNALYRKYDDWTSQSTAQEKTQAAILEAKLTTAQAKHQAKYQEFTKLQEKHSGLLKELKATRDQRVKNVQEQQHTFLGLLRRFSEEEWREKEGRENALAIMATEKEYQKLGEEHKYIDGTEDRPILSVDTLDLDNV